MIREEKGREEGKKFPSIYSANFVVARGRRGGGGERGGEGRGDSRQRQLDASKTFLWKNNVMPTSSYL